MNTIEIPAELVEAAKRMGLDATWLATRLLMNGARELAKVESVRIER